MTFIQTLSSLVNRVRPLGKKGNIDLGCNLRYMETKRLLAGAQLRRETRPAGAEGRVYSSFGEQITALELVNLQVNGVFGHYGIEW